MKSAADDNYRRDVNAAVRNLWSGDETAFDFLERMDRAIHLWFRWVWDEEGARYGIQPQDYTPEEQNALEQAIARQQAYLLPFMNAILASSEANGGHLLPLLQRGDMWVTALEQVRQMAANFFAADQPAEWVVGPTEHCETCLFYEGRVYRRSVWKKYLEPYGLLPRTRGANSGLICRGFKCQCNLADTRKPITPGRPPIFKATGKRTLNDRYSHRTHQGQNARPRALVRANH